MCFAFLAKVKFLAISTTLKNFIGQNVDSAASTSLENNETHIDKTELIKTFVDKNLGSVESWTEFGYVAFLSRRFDKLVQINLI